MFYVVIRSTVVQSIQYDRSVPLNSFKSHYPPDVLGLSSIQNPK